MADAFLNHENAGCSRSRLNFRGDIPPYRAEARRYTARVVAWFRELRETYGVGKADGIGRSVDVNA